MHRMSVLPIYRAEALSSPYGEGANLLQKDKKHSLLAIEKEYASSIYREKKHSLVFTEKEPALYK